ncbi:ATP-binding protein [Spirochaeta africana]|uniref:histidine kinase n=1 Tax=Spirochaeta africana (strain ATCC 700263 / DSM 8902 / Z-7692) TaxID=889378 RepID=H9UFR7_SPIAZ|nr:ATP-binding protein [Spirochaeta africana]AFG36360.1 signal transduction histidine kinase [Spirochaeta africana DSM 8902]
MAERDGFNYLEGTECPVTGLPIIPRPEWSFFTRDNHYTGYITQVGSNVFIYTAIGRPVPEDSPQSAANVHRFLDENLPPDGRFYALFDYSRLVTPPVKNRLNVLKELRALLPRIRLIIFFGMTGSLRSVVQLAVFLSGMGDRMFVCRGYREALHIVRADQLRHGIRNTPAGTGSSAELLKLLTELVWEQNYDVSIPELPEDHQFQQVYQAVEVLRKDLQDLLQENRRKQEILEKANRVKTDFIANMSHEMRTPLNAILGTVQLLQLGRPTHEQQRYLKILHDAADTLLAGVNELLDISAIDDGRLTISPRKTDLPGFLQGVVDMFIPLCSSKQLSIGCELDPALPPVVVLDRDRLRQVLVNLLGNAVKFTARGSIMLRASADDTWLVLHISDTGYGIPADNRSRVFERFVRGETPAAQSGTGLGLAISRELTELMGGQLLLESSSPAGSSFLLQLPLLLPDAAQTAAVAQPAAATQAAGMPQPAAATQAAGMPQPAAAATSSPDTPMEPLKSPSTPIGFAGKLALVVDDNEVNLLILAELLRAEGLEVITASAGESALKLLHQRMVDVVFLDCSMPGMDGFTLARIIREEIAAVDQLPVVAVTAFTEAQYTAAAHAAGMDMVLYKPIRRADLRRVLQQFGSLVAEPDLSRAEWMQPVIRERLDRLLKEDVPNMEQAVAGDNPEELQRIAHSLYGFLAQIDAVWAASLARQLEQHADLAARDRLNIITQLKQAAEGLYTDANPSRT